jgi:uncharacterized DUF497 family protein
MEIEFDPAKDALNRKNHNGLSLSLASELDWSHATYEPDNRFSYGEIRINATVPLGNHLYYVTYTERGEKTRIISLRYATKNEVADYVQDYR